MLPSQCFRMAARCSLAAGTSRSPGFSRRTRKRRPTEARTLRYATDTKETVMRTLEARIDIDAPVDRVWAVLRDTAAYAEWNPFIRTIEGALQPGSRLTVRIEPPGGSGVTFKPTVQAVEPNQRVRWLGRLLLPGIFDGEHSLRLEAINSDHTR